MRYWFLWGKEEKISAFSDIQDIRYLYSINYKTISFLPEYTNIE